MYPTFEVFFHIFMGKKLKFLYIVAYKSEEFVSICSNLYFLELKWLQAHIEFWVRTNIDSSPQTYV